jgi:hydrogenase maturation protease
MKRKQPDDDRNQQVMIESDKNILVMGIGNLLMGDEGLGVHFINEFIKHPMPSHIEIVDGGTGGFHLLSYLQAYPTIILIDAAFDDQEPGTISLIKPKFASDFPPSLSSHDIGLKDLLDSLYLLGHQPEVYLFTVTIDEIQHMSIGLTQPIESAITHLQEKTLQLLNQLANSTKN